MTAGVALSLLLVASSGCSHKTGFVGTWENSIPGNGSLSRITFNADHTMSFVATNGPKQEPYKLTCQGTWSQSGDSLTMVPLSMQLDNVTAKRRIELTPYVNAQLNKPQSAPVVWKGPNAFVQPKDGVDQNFKRVD